MTEQVRLAVVGVGVMGERHARVIAEQHDLELAGVADVDADVAARVAEATDAVAFEDFEALYDAGLDGVVIATPENAHRDPVVAAAGRGLDILLEKPVAESPADEAVIYEAITAADVDVLLGFVLRFDARYGVITQAVREGDLGEVVSIRAERSVVASEAQRLARSDPLLYQTIHDVDLCCWLVDEPVEAVYAAGKQAVFADQDRYDVIVSTIQFADGTVASIETGSILPEDGPAGNRAEFAVTGTDGTAELALPDRDLAISTDLTRYHDSTVFPTVNDRQAGALRSEIDHFARVIRNEVSAPLVSVIDGMYAAAIGRAARRSLSSGRPEPLDHPIDLHEKRRMTQGGTPT